MIIIDQDKEGLFDFGPGIGIDVRDSDNRLGYEIVAYALCSDENDDFTCGFYRDKGVAKTVLDEIAHAVADGKYVFQMPKDGILKEA